MKDEYRDLIRSISKTKLFVLFLVGVILILFPTKLLTVSDYHISSQDLDYGITIDAGSSKTKFILYNWKSLKESGTGCVSELTNEKLNIAVDKYDDNLTELVGVLSTTLEKVSSNINYTHKSSQVPIYLGATAGMRILNATNNKKSSIIVKTIGTAFQRIVNDNKRLKIEKVEIINGNKEGLYAWIATNYLMDNLPYKGRLSSSTVGILEMGGASTQIAFQKICNTEEICMDKVAAVIEHVRLFDINYGVYTYSNLCFGNDEARRRYQLAIIVNQLDEGVSNEVDDPCTHIGQVDRTIDKKQLLLNVCTMNNKTNSSLVHSQYVLKSKPDIGKCKEFTAKLVNATYVKANFGGQYADFKAMEESPPQNMSFYALATYYYTMSQIARNGKLNFEDEDEIRNSIDEYCARPWNDLVKKDNYYNEKEIEYLHNYCFGMNYIFMTLKHVYKFKGKEFSKIEFRQKFDRGDLSWTLGYMLSATGYSPTKKLVLSPTQHVTLVLSGVLLVLSTTIIYFVSLQLSTERNV